MTMYWRDGHFGICGRNFEYADDDKCAMWKYAHENGIHERVAEILCRILQFRVNSVDDSVDALLERAKGKYASGMNKEELVMAEKMLVTQA